MYEHATLQEAYTGSLIAGKGKQLNNIKVIMDRTKFVTEEWTRVRFGAGTPWRRCWCVISPPDEKEVQRQQKAFKKKSAYDREVPVLKGDIRFYDTRKTKKVQPIATIKEAYSAYAIYPQSKPLIDQSTLVKIEGVITIHSKPEATTEGFIFVMPEVHPAVTGFEMMLRFLFPVYDVFGLYGRPCRLIADTLDTRSLMFAMPQERRYGYLEIFDVATLIHTDGSQTWNEKEWRKQLKTLTSQRIAKMQARGSRPGSRVGSRNHRNSLPPRTNQLRFEDGASMRSTPSLHHDVGGYPPPQHTGSAPPGNGPFQPPQKSLSHQRSVSETTPFSTPPRQRTLQETSTNYTPSRLSYEQSRPSYEAVPPPPPVHGIPVATYRNPQVQRYAGDNDGANERSSSESERRVRGATDNESPIQNIQQGLLPSAPPAPVATPPAFAHSPGSVPQTRPYHSPELRRANSRMSSTTLSQLAAAGGAASEGGAAASGVAVAGAAAAWKGNTQQKEGRQSEDPGPRGVNDDVELSASRPNADHIFAHESMGLAGARIPDSNDREQQISTAGSGAQYNNTDNAAYTSPNMPLPSSNLITPSPNASHSVSPLSQSTTYSSPSPPPEMPPVPIAQNFSRFVPPNTQTQQQNLPKDNPPETRPLSSATPTERPDMQRQSTARSISRKPVPSPSTADFPDVPSQPEDVYRARRRSGVSSNYDNESVESPDYASTRKSTETRQSATEADKPRAGLLKTVGTVDPNDKEVMIGDVRYRSDSAQLPADSNIPNVDFGVTQVFKPEVTQPQQMRNQSPGRPLPNPLSSYQSNGQPGVHGQPSPRNPYSRSPNRKPVTPEPEAQRSGSFSFDEGSVRNVPWQPGMTTAGGSPGNKASITPEQYVQQRAAANRVVPVYGHGRNQSSTPPHGSRESSGDWTTPNNRQDMPPRPQSRGASTVMNTSADYTSYLSAREQEHVARVTGSPLINMTGNNPRPVPQTAGLVGAIEAREQEKKAIKQGVSGQMVQQAIAQRQQQAQNQSHHYPQPSPQLHIPGQFPQTPQTPYGAFGNQQQQYMGPQQYRQQHQQWISPADYPAAQVYWNTAVNQYPSAQPQGQYSTQYQQGSQQGPYQGSYQQARQQPHGSYFEDGQ